MKSTLPNVILAILGFNLGAVCLSQQQSDNQFIHATYVNSGKLTQKTIDEADWSQFDFYYVTTGPTWRKDDFESLAPSLKKCVQDHTYATTRWGEPLTPKLIKAIHDANRIVLVSLQSHLERADFPNMAKSPRKRKIFAKVMADFCLKYHFDGVEIDWEHTIVWPDYLELMRELRQSLNDLTEASGKRYFLTTALHPVWKLTPEQQEILVENLDWINLMTYDMGGGNWSNHGDHNTPFDRIRATMLRNWSQFPHDKICLGLASYGYRYTDVIPAKRYPENLGKSHSAYFPYNNLPPLLQKGWRETWDDSAQAPYYFSPDKKNFVTVDNRKSQRIKMDFAFDQRYRGVFWWEFHYDYFPPKTPGTHGRHGLMDHVSQLIEAQRILK